jgi:hypothetical protein
MMRSRASVPMAENMSAYLRTCWADLDIFLYLQKYGEMSSRTESQTPAHELQTWFTSHSVFVHIFLAG